MIYHFWTDYKPRDPATAERQRVAQMTWARQPWTELPIKDSKLPRLWREERRAYPYVRDLFDFACQGLEPDTILVYTNADICVVTDCALRVAGVIQDLDAFYSMRKDFQHTFSEPISDAEVHQCPAYVGSDFYGFRVRWWTKNRDDFPDMLVACELWDAVLRHLIIATNPAALVNVPDLSYHSRHSSWWEAKENRYRLKCQIHNLTTGSAWLRKHGINPAMHGVKEIYENHAVRPGVLAQ